LNFRKHKPVHLFFTSWSALLFASIFIVEICGAVEIPNPKWLNPVLVADKMVINGLPSVVYYFKVDRAAEEVLQFYRTKWQMSEDGKNPGYKENRADNWQVISRLSDKRYLLTVQVKNLEAFTSTGYLAIGDLKNMETRPDVGTDVPQMNGSKVVNDLTSHDPGKKGRSVMIVNDFSVQSNSNFYRQYYSDRNWSQLIDLPQQGGQVLAFRHFGKEAHLVINENFGSTQIVLLLVENL